MEVKVFNLIILDESGSMNCIKRQAIDGVNETFNTIRNAQKENEGQKHYVTFISFDSKHTNVVYDKTPIEEVNALTDKDYNPFAATPLYDAMGFALSELSKSVGDLDLVLVTVITDGYENASKEYSGKAIKAMVDELTQKDWVFTYIGANQDVSKVASSLGISNSMAFREDDLGTQMMFEEERMSRKSFFSRLTDLNSAVDAADYAERKKKVSSMSFFCK